MNLPGIFFASSTCGDTLDRLIKSMDNATNQWTSRAALGHCGWICSDCCSSSSGGMPDACFHGHQGCTEIIHRDKAYAKYTGDQS
jgi:hypothetical protein